jgi:hypothetical protein
MPHRTTIVLPPGLKQQAVERARKEGISLSHLIRRSLKKELETKSKRKPGKTGDPFWDNCVVYDDDSWPADLSARHDDYLYGGGDH